VLTGSSNLGLNKENNDLMTCSTSSNILDGQLTARRSLTACICIVFPQDKSHRDSSHTTLSEHVDDDSVDLKIQNKVYYRKFKLASDEQQHKHVSL
jgi:hypothetical protein